MHQLVVSQPLQIDENEKCLLAAGDAVVFPFFPGEIGGGGGEALDVVGLAVEHQNSSPVSFPAIL